MNVDGIRISRQLGLLALLLGIAGLLAIATPSASAQSAFCQQYPNDPSCIGPIDDDDQDDEDDVVVLDPVPGGAGDGASGASSGELPFTGYPMTPLLLLLLALLATGLAIRGYLAARKRIQAGPPESAA